MTNIYKPLHSTNGNAETEPFITKVNQDKESVTGCNHSGLGAGANLWGGGQNDIPM